MSAFFGSNMLMANICKVKFLKIKNVCKIKSIEKTAKIAQDFYIFIGSLKVTDPCICEIVIVFRQIR